MCYSLALITKGGVRTLVRSVEESKWSRGMASDTQQTCSRHSESTVRFDAEDHGAFRTRPAAQCDPYQRQAESKCSNSSKTQQQWIHEHFLCMHNSSKTVPMSRRLTVWAQLPQITILSFFTITRHMSRCCVTCNVNMMKGDGNTEPRRRKTNTGLSGPHLVIERGALVYCLLCTSFELCSWERVLLMVDYDDCEWSLCSPYALLLSLLSWYGEDLSLKCRRGSCFSCGAVSKMVSKCQVHPIPHGGSFDLFHEDPEVLGKIENAPCNRAFHLS